MGPRFRGDDPRRIHWVRFAKNDVGFVSPKCTSLSYPGRSAARKMASDAFVACRGTRWLVRSLYFPVFFQIRNAPSPVSRSQAHTPPRSRGACLRPGFATLLHSPRNEGWAERRETFGCVRSTRWACHLASKTRVNALMTRDARLSALHRGVSPLRSFPRKRESRSWVPAFAGTNGRGLRHSPLRLQDRLRRRPS